MRQLPRGTVTLLFTDIEGSTRLLEELRGAYADALAEHRRLMREAFARHNGVEVDTQGDAFFIAFARASDAVAAAEEVQRAHADGPVRVRIGIHTGEPTVTDVGYVGLDVHRAARIANAAHGGQVLLSRSTRDLAARDDVHDLGEHRLKDLSTPIHLYQLGDGEFAPLRTLYVTHLPVPATEFIGRRRELAEAEALLARNDVRLLTMTGPGGSGKTRLASEVASALADRYEHGVWWVALSDLARADDVMPAVGREVGGGPAVETIGNRHLLLVLDTFEHVMAAVPDVATLLAECRNVDVLVTSRERLSLQGEHLYPVEPLATDESVELFLARARAIAPRFAADRRLYELCPRLDGLPLAIELAAARTSVLTVEQLLERLGTRLDVLRSARDAEARHRTLRATIEWSFDLLAPEERRLLAAVSMFRGGWTLEAAETVAGADVELLESLLDKNLVRRSEAGRFEMLDSVRDFAAERVSDDERTVFVRRLLEYLVMTFADANLDQDAIGIPQMGLAVTELPNIEVALTWAADSGDALLGLQLLLRTEMYWVANDPPGGHERLEALLAIAAEHVDALDPSLLARALRFRATMLDMNGRYDLSESEYVRARELFRSAGDDVMVGHLTARIANCALRIGNVERANALASESLEVLGGTRTPRTRASPCTYRRWRRSQEATRRPETTWCIGARR